MILTPARGPRCSNALGLPDRALRNPVVGRKNYYGAQAEWAAHLAARVWTLTATAERNGHEPLAYLTDYLDACAEPEANRPTARHSNGSSSGYPPLAAPATTTPRPVTAPATGQRPNPLS